jgi:hypothetical protein
MSTLRLTLACLTCLLLPYTNTTAQSVPARQHYQSLAESLQKAKSAKDWSNYLIASMEFADFSNSSPGSLLILARAYARNNNPAAALTTLQHFAAMGQYSEEVETSADLSPVRQLPGFAPLLKAVQANQSPISRSITSFKLKSLTGLLTEDVDYEPTIAKTFYFTTVLGKRIFAATETGLLHEFAKSPRDWPLMGLKVDFARGQLWATTVALRDFDAVPKAAQGNSEILCYSLKSGKLLREIPGPPGSALGDFALARNGELIVSDNEGGGIYVLAQAASVLQRIDNGEFISPQTPAISDDGNLLFIPDYVRGVAVLNRSTKQVRWLDSQGKYALTGIDGLYLVKDRLIAIQNGSTPERVVMFTLDQPLATLTAETIIERATKTLGDPTHGVVVGDTFYYIANSGWDNLDDHGNPKPNSTPTPPRLMRFTLP